MLFVNSEYFFSVEKRVSQLPSESFSENAPLEANMGYEQIPQMDITVTYKTDFLKHILNTFLFDIELSKKLDIDHF